MDANTSSTNELKKAQIICVIGGPGVGKGTQCTWLAERLGVVHVSVGDLLRVEAEKKSSNIKAIMEAGALVPLDEVQTVLENHLVENVKEGKRCFLVDGFPRSVTQTKLFEDRGCKIKAVLYFHASEEIMLERMLNRAETSGRVDDNLETFKKRYKGFLEDSAGVIAEFQARGSEVPGEGEEEGERSASLRFCKVDCESDLRSIYGEISDLVVEIFGIGSVAG